jgi:tRNA dimethylallyltransferase
MKTKILIVTGPTASGKTDLAIRIAEKNNGEIISADSMQIYRHMNVGTAKPSWPEMKKIEHHLIDVIDPDQPFSVADFRNKSEEIIQKIRDRGKLPIIAGGTGLYINSLVKPWTFSNTPPSDEQRRELQKTFKEKGGGYLYSMLESVDPESAEAIHPNNIKRVMRALEVYMVSGVKKSIQDEESQKNEIPYEPVMIGLNMDRELLYDRIDKRVDIMLEQGLVAEVRRLIEMGYSKDLVSMQGLGYKEIVKYLSGEWTYEHSVYILKRDTRRFAKRQLTWFKRYDEIKWFYIDAYADKEALYADVFDYLDERNII